MVEYMQQFEKAAKARGDDLPISTKVAIEICSYLRGRELEQAMRTLERVMRKEQAIPYRRFTDGVGHKPGRGMASGRYPIKAAGEFLKILRNAQANATNQGMTGTLVIQHIAANRASRPMRNRAKFRGEFKKTHVEVIIIETEPAASKPAAPAAKKPVKKTAPAAPAKEKTAPRAKKAQKETAPADEPAGKKDDGKKASEPVPAETGKETPAEKAEPETRPENKQSTGNKE